MQLYKLNISLPLGSFKDRIPIYRGIRSPQEKRDLCVLLCQACSGGGLCERGPFGQTCSGGGYVREGLFSHGAKAPEFSLQGNVLALLLAGFRKQGKSEFLNSFFFKKNCFSNSFSLGGAVEYILYMWQVPD